jgi:peroxiredoxin
MEMKATMLSKKSQRLPSGWRQRLTPRERRALLALGIFALVVLLLWRPARHFVLTAGVLRSDAPSEAVLTEVVEGASDPGGMLQRIWRRGSFSGRAFVAGHLLRGINSDAPLVRHMEPLLEEAAFDADLEVRETACGILAQQKHPALRRWLREQLRDPDPAVRMLALQQFPRIAVSNDVPVVIPLLDDPDPRVIAVAGSCLKRITGEDFGLKTAHAVPTFAWKPDAPPSPPDWLALQRGRDGWRAWWQAHQSQFPADTDPLRPERSFFARPTPDFALEDIKGHLVRLSNFRGKAVLLTFWNLTNQFSFVDEPALQRLWQKESARLAVLAVALDPALWPVESCGDEHGAEHGESHEHEHAHCHAAKPDSAKSRADARALAARLGVTHPVLLDTTAALVARFDVHDLPAYVLIDAEGNLRRRFAGPRTDAVFEAMVNEATAAENPVAPAP